MKNLSLSIALSLLLGFMMRIEPVQAQVEADFLYLLTSSEDATVVTALNPVDGSSITLLSVPALQNGLSQLYPPTEIDALELYLAEYNAAHNTERSLSEVQHMMGRIESITVSPDNRQVIAKVVYQTCLDRPFPVCFGTTQLVLIDRASQEQSTLFNLGNHDDQFTPIIYGVDEWKIREIQWAPDGQAVVVEIFNASLRSVADAAIVVVPINGAAPFKIGDGFTWVTAPTGDQIVILSSYKHASGRGVTNTFNMVSIDVQTGQFSQSSYILEHYFIDDRSGLAFLGRFVVFLRSFDTRDINGSGGGLAVFDTQTGEASMVLPDQFFHKIQSTPDGSRLVLETPDNLLVEGRFQGGVMSLHPLVSTPVTDWKLGSRGDLLVQFSKGNPYQLRDPQGKAIETLNSLDQYQRQVMQTSGATEIIAVDW